MSFIMDIISKAKEEKKKIVLPESMDERVLQAADKVLREGIADIILIGSENEIRSYEGLDVSKATIINPSSSNLTDTLVNKLYELRKNKGMTMEEARKLLLTDYMYFACMLVNEGLADGVVSGACHSTSNTLRPALQIIKTKPGVKTVSSCVMLVGTNKLGFGENNVLFCGDSGLNIMPNAEELADIAIATAGSAKTFSNINPKVAMLSFSSFGSGGNKDESILKVREALRIAKEKAPDLEIDGEMQLDCALIDSVAKLKGKGSRVAGKANVLIFPDLNAGNIGYKLMERFGKLQAVGVIMQGFNKPINDLSRGCHVEDIVVMTAITVLQTQE